MESKLLKRLVRENPYLDTYHVEECDGQVQHWISAKDGFYFPDQETSTICGFKIRELAQELKYVSIDDR